MKVLLIEDNKNHADSVKKCLNKAFSDVNLAVLRTEHEVLSAMEKVSQENPDIIILDVILPWCDLCENMPELPKNYEGGPYRAGIRCLKAFLNHKKLKNIPIIVLSVVNEENLKTLHSPIPENVLFISKPLEPEKLIETIESFLLFLQPERKKTSTIDNLVDATELQIGTKGLNIDLKKLFKKEN